MNRILFAGGGTAGHVEPAWAVSEVWHKRHPGDEIAFLGTKSGLEVTLIPERDGTLYLIPKVTAPRKIGLPALAFPFQLIKLDQEIIFKEIKIYGKDLNLIKMQRNHKLFLKILKYFVLIAINQ